jgi:hypothetical protein
MQITVCLYATYPMFVPGVLRLCVDLTYFCMHKRVREDAADDRAPTPSTVSIRPSSHQTGCVYGQYNPAADVLSSSADGVIWFPYRSASTIVRTLLIASNTQVTLPIVFPSVNMPPLTVEITFIGDTMVPALINTAGAISISTDSKGFQNGALNGGSVTIKSNGTPLNANFATGDISGAWLFTAMGLTDFNAASIATRCISDSSTVTNNPIATGITFSCPSIPQPHGPVSVRRLQLGGSSCVTGIVHNVQNYIWYSPFATINTATNTFMPDVPWGAIPSFSVTVDTLLPTASTPLLRYAYIFAYADGTGCRLASAFGSTTIPVGPIDHGTALISCPDMNFADIRKYLFIGTALLLDHPTLDIRMKIDAYISDYDDSSLAYPFVARIDNAAAGVGIVVSGQLYQTFVPVGSSAEFLKMSALSDQSSAETWLKHQLMFLSSTPSRRTVS